MKKILLLVFENIFALIQTILSQSINCTPKNFDKFLPKNDYAESSINVKVYTYIVVPNDLTWAQAEKDSIVLAMKNIQAWYQIATGGITFELAFPDSAILYICQNERTYYDTNWWGTLLSEMSANGIPVWQPGYILALWLKGVSGNGMGLGAQWCGSDCGVAMASVEGWPDFNPGTYCNSCPPNSNSSGSVWPCNPRGTMAHELGHTFGLPHPDDPNSPYYSICYPVRNHTLMLTHWEFPYWYATNQDEIPWGLLTKEIQILRNDTDVMKKNIILTQTYPDAPVVNLPDLTVIPSANFSFQVNRYNVNFTNLSTGSNLDYWLFDDGQESNLHDPNHIYSSDRSYNVQLHVSNDSCMISKKTSFIEIISVPELLAKSDFAI